MTCCAASVSKMAAFTTILPLWGDFLVKPDDPEYINGNKACAPAYQVAPSVITISPKKCCASCAGISDRGATCRLHGKHGTADVRLDFQLSGILSPSAIEHGEHAASGPNEYHAESSISEPLTTDTDLC